MLLAGPISHTSTQYMDFVEIFNVSLDLSTVYFANFSGCRASFVYCCHSILECYNLISGVNLSIRSFVLFIQVDIHCCHYWLDTFKSIPSSAATEWTHFS